jgi:hypothetical protein
MRGVVYSLTSILKLSGCMFYFNVEGDGKKGL